MPKTAWRIIAISVSARNFAPSIQGVLIGDKDYKNKSDDFDVKWLLDQLRILSVGLDRTSNGYVQDQTAHQT